MGLCASTQGNGLKKSASRQAMHDIKNHRAKDLLACQPVFTVLKFNKTMQKRIVSLYENCVSGGKGSVKYLYDAIHVDKAHHHYIMRSFTYFNPGGRSFTCPQFCVLVWNLLTLQMNADASAEWSFKVWFGGDDYNSEMDANKQAVFEMLDSSLGLSSKYDYRPKSETYKSVKGFVGNSTDWDMKKGQILMKSCCGTGDVNLLGWTRLAARAKPVTKFPFPVCDEIRTQLKSSKQWQAMTMQRRAFNELDTVIAQINEIDPMCLQNVGGGTNGFRGGGGGSANGGGTGGTVGGKSSGKKNPKQMKKGGMHKKKGGAAGAGGSRKKKSKYAQ